MGLLEAKSLSLRVPDRAGRPLWGVAPRVTLFRDLNLKMEPRGNRRHRRRVRLRQDIARTRAVETCSGSHQAGALPARGLPGYPWCQIRISKTPSGLNVSL